MTQSIDIAAAALAGALAGPWLRARILAHSIPYGRPPRTNCPACRHPLTAPAWRAWLPVTGRCPACRRRIGPAPALVEIAGAVTLAVLAWRSPDLGVFAAALWAAGYGMVLSFVDATVHRLPDRLTMPALAGAASILWADAIATRGYARLVTAGLGAVLLAGFYLAQMMIKPGAVGLGDAKLALVTGLTLGWFGWTAVFTGVVATVLIGAGTAVILLAARRIRLHQAIAYGPAMLLGTLLAYSLYAPL